MQRFSFFYAFVFPFLFLCSPVEAASQKGNKNSVKTDSSTRPKTALLKKKTPNKQKNKKKKDEKPPTRLEWGVLPAISGNSDIGFGFGILMNLAKYEPGFWPYRWRIELLFYMTVKEAPDGGVELPFHNYYVYFDLPGLAGGNLRIDGRVGFRRFTTSGYYGIGNAATFQRPWLDPKYENVDSLSVAEKERYVELRRTYQYDRIFPQIRLNARYALPKKFSFYIGTEMSYNWINLYRNSKLEQDLRTTQNRDDKSAKAEALRSLLFGVQEHLQWIMKVGLVFDNRNQETTPDSGMFHDLSFRFAPGATRYPFGGFTLNSRFFLPIAKPYLVVAFRFIADVLFGNVPFYEMTRFGGLFPDDMTGGSVSIRGIRNKRYHGKVKLLANLEIRSKLIFFNIGSARFNIGLVAFADAARIWADLTPRPELDGDDLGIKLAVGGGLRIQWGESFVVRADYGYSFTETDYTDPNLPFTGSSTGLYITVQHAF